MVYVKSIENLPLMPCSDTKAKHLLKEKKAKIISRSPFTIKLCFKVDNITQEVTLGVDSGSKHIGLSATTGKEELYSSDVEIRDDIHSLLTTRRENRRSRRNRKTRYREMRFDNRVHSKNKGWLAPSVENKINTHLNRIDFVLSILPISRIIIETASFDIQKIKNPDIEGKEYQSGNMLSFWNTREYVLSRDGHKCQCCKGKSKDKVLNVHHIISRKDGGTNAPDNLITLCETCHKSYHKGLLELPSSIEKTQTFKNETFMSIMRWTLFNRLKDKYIPKGIEVLNTYGYITKNTRISANIKKTHTSDAFCISRNINAKRLDTYYYQKKVRCHNRQIHKATILKGGVRKLNQSPYTTKGFRLFDKVKINIPKEKESKYASLNGKIGFIWGRRESGSFLIKTLDGFVLHSGINYKYLTLLEKRKSYITEVRQGV